jgi:hypothetical protein
VAACGGDRREDFATHEPGWNQVQGKAMDRGIRGTTVD